MTPLDVSLFEQEVVLKPLAIDDFPLVTSLQEKCFPGMKTWTREQFTSQVTIFPEGQLGLWYGGRLVASSASLILDFSMYSEWHGWHEVADHGFIRNHNPEGNTLYGIEIMVDPEYRGMKLARRLYAARKALARKYNLMRIVIGGRIPGYGAHAERMSAREYVDQVLDKKLIDPVLTTQIANGFVLKRLLPDYLGADKESKGYATLLEWSNLDYIPDPSRRFVPVKPVRICAVQYEMRYIESFEEFAKQCEFFVDVAADYRCDFVLFPEMFTTQLLSFQPPLRPALAMRKLSEFTPRYLELFSGLAVKYDVNIVGGTHFTIEEDDLYNIAYLFRRDGTIGKQYKLHITPSEKRWWGVKPGQKLEVFETDCGPVSIQICYDVEFPELGRIAAEKGAQIIFVPFCTDERYAYLRVRYCAQARAIENQLYVVMAGSVGNIPKVDNVDIHYAQSAIFTPSDIPFSRDAIQYEATPNIETVIIDDVDLELLKAHRQTGTVLNWKDRRSDLYRIDHSC